MEREGRGENAELCCVARKKERERLAGEREAALWKEREGRER